MFSKRSSFDQTPNRLAQLYAELVAEGRQILDLTVSNPTLCGFDYPDDAILQALSRPAAMTYRPDPRGLPSAREAVAQLYDPQIDPSRIVLAASTSEAYAWLFKLLCEPGDELLIPSPSYPLFEFLAQLEGVRLVQYPLTFEDRWRLDPDALSGKITDRTRALVVVQPNNPTGSYLDHVEIEAVRRSARESGLAILSDEVFFDYPIDEPAGGAGSLVDGDDLLTFVLGGLSKSVGLPQMKLSWILASGPERRVSEALARLELIGDTYLSVGSAVQHALADLIREGGVVQRQIRERIRENRTLLDKIRSSESVWDCLPTEGGWSAVLRVPRVMTDEEWALRLLREDGISLHPGYLYGFEGEGYLVVSLLPQVAVFREGIERFAARVSDIC